MLPSFLIGIVLGLAAIALRLERDSLFYAFLVMLALLLWPSIAMRIKRWHDIGRSDWFVLMNCVPILNVFIDLALGLIPGNVGPNRYGPDPKRSVAPGSNNALERTRHG
jgi:uncharacterized membrane protein YhaH (DUF805 family)